MHSTVSDGWREPDEVAHLAADQGVRVMALTDHDTFLGVHCARLVALRRGLRYVPPRSSCACLTPGRWSLPTHAGGSGARRRPRGDRPTTGFMKSVFPLREGGGGRPPPAQAGADPNLRGGGPPARAADDRRHRLP